MKRFDAIVIGGGPAGLSAAIYIARYNLKVLVIDQETGRWTGHEVNENYLGFPKGIPARKLRELGKAQAERFGTKFSKDEITSLKKSKDGWNVIGRKNWWQAKGVVLATGVTDFYPSFKGLEKYIGRSLFWCIICDGYKVRDKRVLVVGHDDKAVTFCMQLLNFTKKISFLTNSDKGEDAISDTGLQKLKKEHIEVHRGSIEKVIGRGGMMKKVILDTGEELLVDYMMSKQGFHPNSKLAGKAGVILEGEGYIKVDVNQRTNIPGLYAAGDVTSEFAHQVVSAAHQGSGAAVSLNEDLLVSFQKETEKLPPSKSTKKSR